MMKMRRFILSLALACIIQSVLSEDNVKPPIEYIDSVHPIANLTTDNFDTYVTSDDYGAWFIMFYAPWCGHCKRAAPAWIELSKAVEGKANVGMIDGDENSRLTRRFFVTGYPSFIFFNKGKMYTYDSARSVDGWQRFVQDGHKHAIGQDIPLELSSFGQFFAELERTVYQVKELGKEHPFLIVLVAVAFISFLGLSFWCVYQVSEKLNERLNGQNGQNLQQAKDGNTVTEEKTVESTSEADGKKQKTE